MPLVNRNVGLLYITLLGSVIVPFCASS